MLRLIGLEDPKNYFLKNNVSVQHSVIKPNQQKSINTYNSIHAKQLQKSNAIKICEDIDYMDQHLMNKKVKKKLLTFNSSIGVDGIPETIDCKHEIQLLKGENTGNMLVEYCKSDTVNTLN